MEGELERKLAALNINQNNFCKEPIRITPKTRSILSNRKRRPCDLFQDEDEGQPDKKFEIPKNVATDEKLLGNFAYGRKDFDAALKHYKEAIKLDPKEITYYINVAAVYFERKQYEKCIGQCLKAVDIGLANKAEGIYLAKAFTRAAKASRRLSRFTDAKNFCQKALDHHDLLEASNLLKDVERRLRELRFSYHIDPIRAENENELGDALFKEEKFEEALQHFTSAVKNNPNNPLLFINRAACLAQLQKYAEALTDVETSIKLDNNIVSGLILKGKILEKLNRRSEANEVFKKALEMDPKNSIALFGAEQNAAPGNIKLTKEDAGSLEPGQDHQEMQLDLDDPELKQIFENAFEHPDQIASQLADPKVARVMKKIFFDK